MFFKTTPIFTTGKVYHNWRGVIAPNPVKEYSQARQKNVKGKEVCEMTKYWSGRISSVHIRNSCILVMNFAFYVRDL